MSNKTGPERELFNIKHLRKIPSLGILSIKRV